MPTRDFTTTCIVARTSSAKAFLFTVVVPAPLPHVAAHVTDPQLIGLLEANRMHHPPGVIPIPADFPGLLITGILMSCRKLSTSRGPLPLGISGKPESIRLRIHHDEVRLPILFFPRGNLPRANHQVNGIAPLPFTLCVAPSDRVVPVHIDDRMIRSKIFPRSDLISSSLSPNSDTLPVVPRNGDFCDPEICDGDAGKFRIRRQSSPIDKNQVRPFGIDCHARFIRGKEMV